MRAVSRPRVFLPLGLVLSAASWLVLWLWDGSPYARYLHHVDWSESGLAALCRLVPAATTVMPAVLYIAAWVLMIVAMMLPTTVSLLDVFRRMTSARPDTTRLTLLVVLGYVCVWCAFGVLVHLADNVLHTLAWRTPWLAWHGWLVGAALLTVAGAYQFSAFKYRCLDKCRSPLMFVIEQWHGRHVLRDSLVLGVRHGAFCVGCCWALMLLLFVVGSGSVGWMLAIGAVMAAEKNLDWGRKLSAPLGAGLLAWAGVTVVGHLLAA